MWLTVRSRLPASCVGDKNPDNGEVSGKSPREVVEVSRFGTSFVLAVLVVMTIAVPLRAACDAVRVENTGVQRLKYSIYIVGRAVNESDEDLATLAVGFALYDENGEQVGDATDTTGGLEAGEAWTFRALATEEDFEDYELNLLHCP